MLRCNENYCASARGPPGSRLRAEPGPARAYSRQIPRTQPLFRNNPLPTAGSHGRPMPVSNGNGKMRRRFRAEILETRTKACPRSFDRLVARSYPAQTTILRPIAQSLASSSVCKRPTHLPASEGIPEAGGQGPDPSRPERYWPSGARSSSRSRTAPLQGE